MVGFRPKVENTRPLYLNNNRMYCVYASFSKSAAISKLIRISIVAGYSIFAPKIFNVRSKEVLTFIRGMSNFSARGRSVGRISGISSHLLCSSNKTTLPSSFACNAALNSSGRKTEAEEKASDKVLTNPTIGYDPHRQALPNESWTKDTLDLYNMFQNEADMSNGLWVKRKWYPSSQTGYRKFSLCLWDQKGKGFEYCLFVNEKEERLRGVFQFGPYTEGPIGHVHGGAIATAMDAAIGVCINVCGYSAVTANLSTSMKIDVAIGSTVLVESRVDRVEGRKVFGYAEMKSPDGSITYATATALFIQVYKSPDHKETKNQNTNQALNSSGIKAECKEMVRNKELSKLTIGHDNYDNRNSPNETWNNNSLELYNKLQNEVDESNGLWFKERVLYPSQIGYRNFPMCLWDQKGKLFEFSFFGNKREKRLRGVFQFGPYTEGPIGHVHGGAIATAMDVALALCNYSSGSPSMTANLSVDFKAVIAIGSTVLLVSRVDRVEGRKVFGYAEMKSPDGSITYATATALFIRVT